MSAYADVEMVGTGQKILDVHFCTEPQTGDIITIDQPGNWLRVTGRRHNASSAAYSLVKLTLICEPITRTDHSSSP